MTLSPAVIGTPRSAAIPQTYARRADGRWVLVGAIALGLTSVASSSAFMAQFPHGTIVLPWSFPPISIVAFIGCGALLGTYVFLRPDRYWSTLVSSTVLTAGVFVLRFPLFDEWLAMALAVAGALACVARRVPVRRSRIRIGWIALFVGLCAYLLLEVFVGLWLYGNLKSLRFVITFGAALLIGWTTARYDFPRPTGREVTLLIALTGLTYYLLVLLHGAVFPQYAWELILEGIGGADVIHESVAGVVAMPAAMILLGDRSGRRKSLGVALILVSLTVTLFADSRAGMLCIMMALVASLFALRARVSAALWTSAVAGAVLVGIVFIGRPAWILDMVGAMIEARNVQSGVIETEYYGRIVAHARGDAGRAYYVLGGIETLQSEGPRVTLMGAGLYGYFPVAGKHYEEAARRGGIATFVVNLGSSVGGVQEPPRPPSLGVLIAETGLIGLFLLGSCAGLAVASALFRRKAGAHGFRISFRENVLVASTVLLALAWTYFGDASETIFFFLLIMPYGIVHTWGQVDQEASPRPYRAAR